MKRRRGKDVNPKMTTYSDSELRLWKLLMGEQMHLGGMDSSIALADAAKINNLRCGVDLCCGSGASMRFMIRWRNIERMLGIDHCDSAILRGHEHCTDEGMENRINFVHADACNSGLPDACADFAWAEDGWSYMRDKELIINEAVRLVKTGASIAFTEWVAVPGWASSAEAERVMKFMKYKGIASIEEYCSMLESTGCEIKLAEERGDLGSAMCLFVEILTRQQRFDALGILQNDVQKLEGIIEELRFVWQMALAGNLSHGLIVARKKH